MKPDRFLKGISLILILCLGLSFTALAAEPEEAAPGKELRITHVSEFLQFAESCRMDSYSRDLTVHLTIDIDLSQQDFHGIPYFAGTLYGHRHSITGLSLTGDGSNVGLFRYLAEGSLVQDLNVEGTVSPGGSGLRVGGIAGSNEGTIQNCSFRGTLSAVDLAGGIAGENALSGRILNCRTDGTFSADHFLGGITGQNYGVIRDCLNSAEINTSVRETTMDVASISLDTIAGTEDPNTVTDIGGIAGTSTGVIRDSVNRANVGYPHMGYNIGGITGSQSGFLTGCRNEGRICGRKETGGIVGQMEPTSHIEFKEDTLQVLETQLAGASSLLSQASSNAQNNMGSLGQGIASMQEDAETAKEALEDLAAQEHPDPDAFIAAKNALQDSLRSMHATMGDMSRAAGNAAGQLGRDLKAVSSQMGAMSNTIKKANEGMGLTLRDISDLDREEDTEGKISYCKNLGDVEGDLNTGGIVGSIAFENDLDPEEDLEFTGEQSLNLEGSLRAVIRNCSNCGTISVKRIQAGGIAGYTALGLIRDCTNTGALKGEKAQYVGGIAGNSKGYLRFCSAKCRLEGDSFLGGIAGSGTIVTDCLSMVSLETGREKLGAVLGLSEKPQDPEITDPVCRNLYMRFEKDPGAIDGISYEGLGQPVAPHKLLQLEKLPESFRKATLIFREESGKEHTLSLPLGSILREEDIPQVPGKENFDGQWEGLSQDLRTRIYFDRVYVPLYTPHRITIRSLRQRSDGRPLLLAEGIFPDMDQIDLQEMVLPDLTDRKILEAWSLPVFSGKKATPLRLHLEEGQDPRVLRILVLRKDGTWQEVSTETDARSLVFQAEPGDQGFCVEQVPDYRKIIKLSVWAGIGILAVTALITLRVVKKRSRKTIKNS